MANIEIDGKKIEARDGAMVIEAADEAGIYIPRFCYHKKLSIAANCRMCLVEVEKAAKPLPACATPVTDGMKVFTKSVKAIDAQKGVMEFLLINHPLDCPICDQGGECELQDIAMGYGSDVSKFVEKKRVVKDKDLGPLIATDMTRCIHCTRCVRFGAEIAGIRELGATGRGEHMEIGTYITRNVTSEMSGNVIDLCPVGALTSKPFRFSARAWELTARYSVAPHDCIGSNLQVHVRNGREVVRVAPRENEAINETWISDRDRFSYEALNSVERLKTPLIKLEGEWKETDWETALQATVSGINRVIAESGVESFAALASPTATIEELYLLQKLMRQLRIANIDHRYRQTDFTFSNEDPVYPWLGQDIQSLENNNAVLLIGSNVRKDQPIAAHRLRKACHNGLKLMHLNAVDYEFYMPVAAKIVVSPKSFVSELAGIAAALVKASGKPAPAGFDKISAGVTLTTAYQQIADNLQRNKNTSVLLGPQAINHPHASSIRMLASLIASLSQSRFGYLPEAGNSAGAWICGFVPHRVAGGARAESMGMNAGQMLDKSLKGYLLLNVEPDVESANPAHAKNALNNADFVVALSYFGSENIKQYADVILPVAPFAETSGTFVNAQGTWQSFTGVVPPPGDARPAWKVFRVLGNLFKCEGFDYVTSDEVLKEIREKAGTITANNNIPWRCPDLPIASKGSGIMRIAEWQMYAGDSMQRRAQALQATFDADIAAIRINKRLAGKIGVVDGANAVVSQNGANVTLPVIIDELVTDDSVLIHAGLEASSNLDSSLTPLTIKPV
ncbi:MAG: NADH-quinone oxidoreductase subunit NuoG [Gammaproteobacteria bacterium]|nr:NADH-quinone oxidoreductase subunit NuoG [Gammaproteobacteria bacterium]